MANVLRVIFYIIFTSFSRSENKRLLKTFTIKYAPEDGPQSRSAARAQRVWGAGKTPLEHSGTWFYLDETQIQQIRVSEAL